MEASLDHAQGWSMCGEEGGRRPDGRRVGYELKCEPAGVGEGRPAEGE